MKVPRLALTLSLFAIFSARSAEAQLADTPWPTLNRDLQRTGRTDVVGPQTPTVKWRFRVGGACYSGIAIAPDGTIYFGSNDYFVYAVNPNGTEKWRFRTGFYVHSAGPTVAADGTVYIGSTDDHLYALRPDGTEKWRFDTGPDSEDPAHIYGTPSIDEDGVVYVGSRLPNLYAIDPNGRELWRLRLRFGAWFGASPAMGHDGRLYLTPYSAGGVACVDRGGNLIWEAPDIESYSGCVIDSRGVSYAMTTDGLVAVNPDGSRRWIQTAIRRTTASLPCVAADGTLYAADGKLHAVSPEGARLWSSEDGPAGYPIIDGAGTIYVGSENEELAAFKTDGERLWSLPTVGTTTRSTFALDADGTLYGEDGAGYLVAVRDPAIPAVNTDIEVVYGGHVSGGLIALGDSDDSYLVLSSHPFHQLSEPNRSVFTLVGSTDVGSPQLMDVKIEVRLSLPGGVCKVAFRDFDTGQFTPYVGFATTIEDRVHWITGVPGGQFVRDDGRIEMEIKTVIRDPITESTFRSYFDEVRIEVRDLP